jgi:hypothetical protein
MPKSNNLNLYLFFAFLILSCNLNAQIAVERKWHQEVYDDKTAIFCLKNLTMCELDALLGDEEIEFINEEKVIIKSYLHDSPIKIITLKDLNWKPISPRQ